MFAFVSASFIVLCVHILLVYHFYAAQLTVKSIADLLLFTVIAHRYAIASGNAFGKIDLFHTSKSAISFLLVVGVLELLS